MLQKLAEWTQEVPLAKNRGTQNPEFARFAAHLVIAFRFRSAAAGPNSSPFGSVWLADPRSDTVVEAYVQHLINAKKVCTPFYLLGLFQTKVNGVPPNISIVVLH